VLLKLELGRIRIEDVAFGPKTQVRDHRLEICQEELCALLRQDSDVADVRVELAHPGEGVRIIPIKDVIEPRAKVGGAEGVFPGFVAGTDTVGYGMTGVPWA
jgi:glycine reductase